MEIAEDLISKGFNPSKVIHMKNNKTAGFMPLFMIVLPRTDKKILEVNQILHLAIQIETLTLNTSTQIGQCYRCQRFGHSQSNCKATLRCVKCVCLLLKTGKPTCANCNGHHVSSYRAARAPQNQKK